MALGCWVKFSKKASIFLQRFPRFIRILNRMEYNRPSQKSRDQGGGWFQILPQQGITSSMLVLKIINEFVYFLIFLTPY